VVDHLVEVAPNAGRPDARFLRLEIQHLTDDSGFPEQVLVERRAVGGDGVSAVRDHRQAEGSVAGDALSARHVGCDLLPVPLLQKEEWKARRTALRPVPEKGAVDPGAEGLDSLRIASQSVKAGRHVPDAMNE
jgi:hypothetical protein